MEGLLATSIAPRVVCTLIRQGLFVGQECKVVQIWVQMRLPALSTVMYRAAHYNIHT